MRCAPEADTQGPKDRPADTAEQAEALMPEALVSMETTPYVGVRALVRRELAPVGFQLEKPTIEDIILALVKGKKQ